MFVDVSTPSFSIKSGNLTMGCLLPISIVKPGVAGTPADLDFLVLQANSESVSKQKQKDEVLHFFIYSFFCC